MSLAKVKEIIFEKVQAEIYVAHEAISIYTTIAEFSEKLNNSNYSHFFGVVQRQALSAFVLSMCKLFEKQDKQYPNFSICTSLNYLRTALKNEVLSIPNIATLDEYIRSRLDPTFSLLNKSHVGDAANIILTHFENQCPQSSIREGMKFDQIFNALKVLRDKRVAHHEEVDLEGLATADLESTIELLCFAQTFVNIIGYGFFGFSMNTIAKPTDFSPEKSKACQQLKRMLQN